MKHSRFDLHHINPSSRGGKTNEFNIFPYIKKKHVGWHEIFLNMQIWDVWDNIEKIHKLIFQNKMSTTNRSWLVLADLPSDTDLRDQINKIYNVSYLQKMWLQAFGSRKLNKARAFLNLLMLFMVFGSDTVLTDKLFDNGNLAEFFKEFPPKDERYWAFMVCFAHNSNWPSIKFKIRKILKQASP